MDTEQALFQAIHQAPDDDLAWLALADWLEEQGEAARAELLRTHRALRSMPKGRPRRANEARLRELLAAGARPCVPTLTNSIGMQFVLIPAGTFLMGAAPKEVGRSAAERQHEVEIARPFYLGAYLVTRAQYRQITRRSPSRSWGGTTAPPAPRGSTSIPSRSGACRGRIAGVFATSSRSARRR